MTRKTILTSAILLTGALLLISGCCMKRDVIRLEDRLIKIDADQEEVNRSVERLDSLLTSEGEASMQLRAEIRSAVNDLLTEFQAIQANMQDLQDKVAFLTESGGARPVIMEPFVQTDSTDSTASGTPVIPGIDCQELYDESFIFMRRGQYEEALIGFADYLKYCGTEDKADNARFWTGESYYSMKRYKDAISEFDLLLRDYPDSEKRPGALYKIARSHEELGQTNDAKEIFQKLVNDHPETLEGEQAREKLKEYR